VTGTNADLPDQGETDTAAGDGAAGTAGDDRVTAAREQLRAYALSLPEAWEDFPWGEPVIKVRKKVFLFLGPWDGAGLTLSVKLSDQRQAEALSLPFVRPTGYGLGRSGWITAAFQPGETPLTGWLIDWVRDSYRAVAPKALGARV
jgi:predicted DNA-binding protein (MmcQ/YjbR family)